MLLTWNKIVIIIYKLLLAVIFKGKVDLVRNFKGKLHSEIILL